MSRKPVNPKTLLSCALTIGLAGWSSKSEGAVILTPDAIFSVSAGEFNPTFAASNLINGSVTDPFVSGLTDFDTYVATAGSSTDNGTPWTASAGNTTATIVFDLGDIFELKAMAIWNSPPGSFPGPGQGSNSVTVEIDDNPGFLSPTQVGGTNLLASTQLQVAGGFAFDFDPLATVSTRYVRLVIDSTNSGSAPVSLNEVAFAVNPIPEPSLSLLLITGALFIGRRRRGDDHINPL